MAGAQVTVRADGADIASLRTTADGTARFLPALYGATQSTEFTFTTGDDRRLARPARRLHRGRAPPAAAPTRWRSM